MDNEDLAKNYEVKITELEDLLQVLKTKMEENKENFEKKIKQNEVDIVRLEQENKSLKNMGNSANEKFLGDISCLKKENEAFARECISYKKQLAASHERENNLNNELNQISMRNEEQATEFKMKLKEQSDLRVREIQTQNGLLTNQIAKLKEEINFLNLKVQEKEEEITQIMKENDSLNHKFIAELRERDEDIQKLKFALEREQQHQEILKQTPEELITPARNPPSSLESNNLKLEIENIQLKLNGILLFKKI